MLNESEERARRARNAVTFSFPDIMRKVFFSDLIIETTRSNGDTEAADLMQADLDRRLDELVETCRQVADLSRQSA